MNLLKYKFKKYIFALKKFHRYTSLTFNDYSIYLKPGKYKFDFNYAYYYLKGFNHSRYPEKLFEKSRTKFGTNFLENFVLKISYFLIALFSKKNVSENSNFKQYEAELVFNKRGAGFKFFDPYNRKVFTILSVLDGLKSVDEIKLVNEHFDTPIIETHKDGKVIIEDWILETPLDELNQCDSLMIYINFLKDLNHFIADYDFSSVVKVNSKSVLNDFEWVISNLPFQTLEKIKQLNLDFPLVHFFADIGLHNILIKKNKYKMIDYDGFREISPFTIALNFLVSMSNKTPFKALYNYKKGTFDLYFKELFNYLKLEYDPNLKEIYFIYSYLIEMYIHQNFTDNRLGKAEKLNRIKTRFNAIMKKYYSIKVP